MRGIRQAKKGPGYPMGYLSGSLKRRTGARMRAELVKTVAELVGAAVVGRKISRRFAGCGVGCCGAWALVPAVVFAAMGVESGE